MTSHRARQLLRPSRPGHKKHNGRDLDDAASSAFNPYVTFLIPTQIRRIDAPCSR